MHHSIDIRPIPDKAFYVNEVALANPVDYYDTAECVRQASRGENLPQDNVRVYVPLDLNKDLLLYEVRTLYRSLGSPNEANESSFASAVDQIISKLEIYDQVWIVRNVGHAVRMKNGDAPDILHSNQAIEAAREMIRVFEQNEGTAECFPYDVVNALKQEYGL